MIPKSEVPGDASAEDLSGVKNQDASLLTENTKARLPALFPAAFSKPIPLKVGIFADLRAATDIAPDALTAFLMKWCGDARYLKNIRKGKSRIDLAGLPAGTVSQNEESHAKLRAQEVFQSRLQK